LFNLIYFGFSLFGLKVQDFFNSFFCKNVVTTTNSFIPHSAPQKRSHPHKPKQRTACSSASLSHYPTNPNSELLAAALCYRTPTSQKRFLRSASLSHSQHPKKGIACSSASLSHSHIPKAIALSYPTIFS